MGEILAEYFVEEKCWECELRGMIEIHSDGGKEKKGKGDTYRSRW